MRIHGAPAGATTFPKSNDRSVVALVKLAGSTASRSTLWRKDRPLFEVRNAHRTNTVEELRAALQGPFSQLEGDVRGGLNPPHQLELRHDPGMEVGDNLTLAQWLEIGKASGRGLKLDVKEPGHFGAILHTVTRSGVPAERLTFNLGDGASDRWAPEIRRRFPQATIALNPRGANTGPLTPAQVARFQELANKVGEPCTFVLRDDQVSPAVVRSLEATAPISVWNDVGREGVDDPDRRVAQLRRLGCSGVLDLRKSEGRLQKAEGLIKRGLGLFQDGFNRL